MPPYLNAVQKNCHLEERQEVMTPARPHTPQVARIKFSRWTHNILYVPEWSSIHCFNGNPKQPVNKQNLAAESTAPAAQWWTNESRFFRYENWGEKKTENQTNQGWWKKESPRHHANRLLFLFPPQTLLSLHRSLNNWAGFDIWYCTGSYYLWDWKEQGNLNIHFIRLFHKASMNSHCRVRLTWQIKHCSTHEFLH